MTRLLFRLCGLLRRRSTKKGSVHVAVEGFHFEDIVGGNPMGGFHRLRTVE